MAEPDACSVSIDLEEKKPYGGKVGTYVQVRRWCDGRACEAGKPRAPHV